MTLQIIDGDSVALEALTAASEAAMVGGLADWFAVTALFRHPLGIPIPHTAIIPNRKDAIGESLGSFVEQNFMSPDVVAARIGEAQVVDRVGHWLTIPENADRVADQAMAAVNGVAGAVDDASLARSVQERVERRLDDIDAAAVLGRLIEVTMEGGHHEPLVEATLGGADRFLEENTDMLRDQLHSASPWWVPGPLDDRVYEKIAFEVAKFIGEVRGDPAHPIRRHLDERARRFADELRTSPELRERGERLKRELLSHPEVRAWTGRLWHEAKAALSEMTDEASAGSSELRNQLTKSVMSLGERIGNDPDFAASIEGYIVSATTDVLGRHGHEIAALISSTVERWDATETSDRIEQQVGRDLQFIRINGTIVGGLAGLAIFTISRLI